MWKPPINFVTLHYAYILGCCILGFLIIYAYGNLDAVDAFFFSVSGNTESGLNTIDVKALKTYQQLAIYIFPIITNLGFINIVVVIVRLHWFEKRLKQVGSSLQLKRLPGSSAATSDERNADVEHGTSSVLVTSEPPASSQPPHDYQTGVDPSTKNLVGRNSWTVDDPNLTVVGQSVSWAEGTLNSPKSKALWIPPPQERDKGRPIEEVDKITSDNDEDDELDLKEIDSGAGPSNLKHRYPRRLVSVATGVALERVASSLFVLGEDPQRRPSLSSKRSCSNQSHTLPALSAQATVGRNSKFRHLTAKDREQLGGIEYRALRLLLKFVIGYFVGLHVLGVICLLPWIYTSAPKFGNYLDDQGQNRTWWAFYSSQTMVNNLGFTLTADSMMHFADATWPLLIMTFLAYAGNTCYPILLRGSIWTFSKIIPKKSSLQDPIRFLLDHPRRCYTLLFPSRPTWILFGILFILNFVDILLIIVLDLHNPAVADLEPGHRVVAAIFQAASSRHTGTATFNLADVNPAVQFSLMVMMYIAVFPIAFSIRVSNTYEERSLGKYSGDADLEDSQSSHAYLMNHIRNQLSFDLWYIFIGVFCICIAEAKRIADVNDPAFSVFSILFEVVSGYANVGLSLGYPTVWTSLSGKFTTFSKLVICAMMIRGRHRGLPYALDRAIVMPGDDFVWDEQHAVTPATVPPVGLKMKRFHTR